MIHTNNADDDFHTGHINGSYVGSHDGPFVLMAGDYVLIANKIEASYRCGCNIQNIFYAGCEKCDDPYGAYHAYYQIIAISELGDVLLETGATIPRSVLEEEELYNYKQAWRT